MNKVTWSTKATAVAVGLAVLTTLGGAPNLKARRNGQTAANRGKSQDGERSLFLNPQLQRAFSLSEGNSPKQTRSGRKEDYTPVVTTIHEPAATAIPSSIAFSNVTKSEGPQTFIELSLVILPSGTAAEPSETAYCAYLTHAVPESVKVAKGQVGSREWTTMIPPRPAEFDPPPDDTDPANRITDIFNVGDPVLAANPSATAEQPALYLAALTWKSPADSLDTWHKNGLTVWSYNPANTNPQWEKINVFALSSEPFERLDKPAIAVSQSGDVYLAYVAERRCQPYVCNTIEFIRYDAATKEWSPAITVPETDPGQTPPPPRGQATPRLDVDPQSGNVYLSWIDAIAHTLNVREFWKENNAFGLRSYYDDPLMLYHYAERSENISANGVEAFIPTRFLSTSISTKNHKMVLAYHRRRSDSDTTGSEVVVLSYDGTQPLGSRLGELTPLANRDDHYRWLPSVACGPDGKCMVSYYDRDVSDTIGLRYTVNAVSVDDTGTTIGGATGLALGAERQLWTSRSDIPAFYPSSFPTIGGMEYQDARWFNNNWYAGSIVADPHSPGHLQDVVIMNVDCGPPSILSGPVYTPAGSFPSTPRLSVTAGGCGPLTYHWYAGTSPDTSQPIGNDSPTIDAPSRATPADYWVRVSASGANPVDSPKVTVAASPPRRRAVKITWNGNVVAVAPDGASLEVSVDLEPGESVTSWQATDMNGNHNLLATDGLLHNQQPHETTTYTAGISNSAGTTPSSGPVEICSQPAIVVQPASASSASGSVSAQVQASGTPVYKWYEGDSGNTSSPIPDFVAGQAQLLSASVNKVTLSSTSDVTRKVWARITTCGGVVDSKSVTLTLSTCKPPVLGGVAYGGEILNNESVQFFLVHDEPEPDTGYTYGYQWYRGSDDQPITGATGDRFTTSTSTFETFYCIVTKHCGPNVVQTTSTRGYLWQRGVCDFPPLLTSQTATDIGIGGKVTFTALDDWPGLSYQWYMGESGDASQPVPGDFGAPDRLTVYAPYNRPHPYWVRVSISCGAYHDSATLTFSKNGCSPIVFMPPPQSSDVVSGADATLTANTPLASPPVLQYEWFSLTPDTGARHSEGTGDVFTARAVRKTTRYLVSAANNCSQSVASQITETVDSQVATVRVSSCPQITNISVTQTPPDSWVKGGDSVTLTVTSSGVTPIYQWYRGVVGDERDPIANATSSSYVTGALMASADYWVRLQDGSGCTADSNTIHVNACGSLHANESGVPFDQVIHPYESAVVWYPVIGAKVAYQWYIGLPPVNGVGGDFSRPIGNSSDAIRVGLIADTMTFWVRATDQCGGYINSPAIRVSVRPQIRQQPVAALDTVMPGLTTTLTADGGTVSASYQWYQVRTNDTSLAFGTNSLTVTTPPITADTQFFLRISSGSAYVDSDAVTVHVCGPINVLWGTGTATNVAYDTHFSLVVFPPPDATEFDFYRGVSGDVEHSTLLRRSAVSGYDANPITETTSYWVRVLNASGNCWGDSTTRTVRLCIPAITQSPASILISQGATTTLSVTATPPGLVTYQWYEGQKSDTSKPVTGLGTGSSYQAHPDTTTSYWVRVDGGCGFTADSDTATVTVCVAPSQPVPQTAPSVASGHPAVLSVSATGTNLTYQWYAGSSGDTSTAIGSTDSSITVSPNDTSDYWVRVIGACGTQDSPTITVHVCAIIGQQPAAASDHVMSGATTTLNATGGSRGATFQWYAGEVGDTSHPFGTPTLTVTTPPITGDTKFWLRMTSGSCYTDSNTVMVYVCALPSVSWTTQPSSSIAWGTTYTLQIAAPPEGSAIYWYQGTSGDLAHSSLLRISYAGSAYTTPVLTQTTTFWARVENGSCTSDSATFTVNVCIPVISQSPASDMITIGQSRTLTVVATPAAVTYQWYTGTAGDTSHPIANATSASYIASPSVTTSYWVRVTGCGNPADSDTATITLCQPPAVTNPVPSQTIVQGHSVAIYVTASGTNLSYQWYVGPAGNVAASIATGPSAYAMTVSPNDTTSYWVRVTGTCGTMDSSAITVAVCATPTMTTQPQSVSIFSAASTTLSVASSESTSSTVTYQWYRGNTGDTSTLVGTGTSFTTPALTSPTSYWVRASCSICTPADSQTATVSMCAIPSTLPPPGDSYIAIGGTATLSTITGTGNTYAWYVGASGNTSQFAGYTTASMAITPTVSTSYWCRVQNGTCVTATPSATVYVCIPTITQQPQSIMINPGVPTTLSVAANTPGLTYQWYTGASGTTTSPLAGQTGSTLTVTPSSATSYWVRVMGNCNRPTDSATATVSICQVPSVTASQTSLSIARGQTATISVNASGTGISYQWYIGPAGNTAASYATGSSALAIQVSPQDTTSYWARVTGTCGTRDSSNIVVNVCAPPAITSQPQSVSVISGTTATLSVASSEATVTPVTYQWYRGNSGDTTTSVGTGTSFTTPAMTSQTNYWVRLSCGVCNPVDSNTATVSICPYPATLSSPGNVNIALGQAATLSTITGTGNTYAWYVGASGNTSQFAGYATASISIAPTVTTSYWCRVTNGTCVSATQTATVNVCVPTFTQQPADITILSGASTTLVSSANTAGVTYRWYTGAVGNTSSPVTNGTTASITVSPSSTTSYWVRATGSCGANTDSFAATVTICPAPVITTQPSNTVPVQPGGMAYFGVVASGSNLTYQWYYGETGNTSSAIYGVTGANYGNSLYSTIRIWVRVFSQCGSADSVAVWGSVYPRINQQPDENIEVGYNATASTTLAADGTYLHYSWKWGYVPVPGAADSPTLVTPSITSNTYAYCLVTSGVAVVQSNQTNLNLCYEGPYISSITKNGGTITVSANGGYGTSYTWYQGARGDISHQVGSYNWLSPSGPGTYWCRVYPGYFASDPTCYSDSDAVVFP